MGRQLVGLLMVAALAAATIGCGSGGGSSAASAANQPTADQLKARGVSTHARTPVYNPKAKPSGVGSH